MKSTDILFFKGKLVSLRKKDGFALVGTIIEVKDDCVLFKSDTATALISLDTIGSLVKKDED